MQFDHQRDEIVSAAFGARDERCQIVRRVRDIGVGQQQVIGFSGAGGLDAAAHCPKLAGPAGRERVGVDDGQVIRLADRDGRPRAAAAVPSPLWSSTRIR